MIIWSINFVLWTRYFSFFLPNQQRTYKNSVPATYSIFLFNHKPSVILTTDLTILWRNSSGTRILEPNECSTSRGAHSYWLGTGCKVQNRRDIKLPTYLHLLHKSIFTAAAPALPLTYQFVSTVPLYPVSASVKTVLRIFMKSSQPKDIFPVLLDRFHKYRISFAHSNLEVLICKQGPSGIQACESKLRISNRCEGVQLAITRSYFGCVQYVPLFHLANICQWQEPRQIAVHKGKRRWRKIVERFKKLTSRRRKQWETTRKILKRRALNTYGLGTLVELTTIGYSSALCGQSSEYCGLHKRMELSRLAEQRCQHRVDLLARKCSRRCKQAGVMYEMQYMVYTSRSYVWTTVDGVHK